MKANKIFISAPISVDWSTVLGFISSVNKEGFTPRYWDRNTKYDQSEFDDCRSVVFILPKNKFDAYSEELPVGIKSELSRAYAQSKKIYVGYQTSTGSYNIYDADTNGKWIRATSGTANDIFGELKSEILKSEIKNAKMAERVMKNSTYGTMVHNPCAEVKLPKAQKVYATTIPNPDWIDERLLLML